jgi:hypothetical protein
MSATAATLVRRPASLRRGLMLLLALVVLAVQTSLPAHQDSHPLNQDDSACHYCMAGGHAPGVPTAALSLPVIRFAIETPRAYAERPATEPLVRTRYSRGPPSRI